MLCGTAQLTKIDRSFTKCLTLILQEKKKNSLFCVFIIKKKKWSFDISNTPQIAAQLAFYVCRFNSHLQPFTADLTRTERRCQYRWRRGEPGHPVSPDLLYPVSSVGPKTRLSRAKPSPLLFISSQQTALLFVCHPSDK